MTVCYSLSDVTFGYGQTPILHIEKLDIEAGQLVFITGESGIGKSTFLEGIGLMSSTVLPLTGPARFHILGRDVDVPDAWAKDLPVLNEIRQTSFSFIFQSTNLLSNLSLRENVAMASMREDGWDEARFQTLLKALDLDPQLADRMPGHISGGQRQRIAFIRAMMTPFDVLLGDEPTGNLDPDNARLLFAALKEDLSQRRKSAVIVTHHLDLAEAFGDRILNIERPRGQSISRMMERPLHHEHSS